MNNVIINDFHLGGKNMICVTETTNIKALADSPSAMQSCLVSSSFSSISSFFRSVVKTVSGKTCHLDIFWAMALDAVDALSDDDVARGDDRAQSPKPKASPKMKSAAKPKAKGKAKGAPKTMKKPAASAKSESGTTMKRPSRKDPDHVSTCKSRYKNGVYSIKLFQKEVIRVSRLHVIDLTCCSCQILNHKHSSLCRFPWYAR